MRPRVAFLTDIPTPYALAVFEELATRVELTALFCSQTGSRAMEWDLDRETAFASRVVGGAMRSRGGPNGTDYYFSPRILVRLAQSRPEVVIAGGFSFPSLYAAAYTRARGARLLIHSDGTAASEANFGRGQHMTRRVLARAAHGAVGNSAPASERFRELGFAPVFKAPHSTRVEPFVAVGDQRRYDTSGPLRVLSVGRLIPRKGNAELIEALGLVRARGIDVELAIVGSGPEEEPLRTLAERLGVPVEWRGFVDQAGLPDEYARADAFAFPTFRDPFGIVMIEAAASGLPIVASPHGGATVDMIEDGVNGLVVEPSDREAIADAIGRLAQDQALRERLGGAALATGRVRSPAQTAEGYYAAVQAVVRS